MSKKKAVCFTANHNIGTQLNRTIMSCFIHLTREDMLNALQSDQIFISGKMYKVPEYQLLECLITQKYGKVKMDFELIAD